MSNSNIATGLRPIMNNGQPFTGQGRMVAFKSGDSNNIFIGDPLVPTTGTDAYGVPYVTIATAGATNTILGGFMGVCNGPAGLGGSAAFTMTRDATVYRQASIANYGWVADDPNQLYAIEEDGDGGAIDATVAGFSNGNLVSGTGSTVTGFSGWMLDSSTVSNTANATYQLRLVGLLRGPDNALGLAAKWAVRINLPALWAAAGY